MREAAIRSRCSGWTACATSVAERLQNELQLWSWTQKSRPSEWNVIVHVLKTPFHRHPILRNAVKARVEIGQ